MTATTIAIVHERLTEIAGSEHVVRELANEWPDALVHVPIARPEGVDPEIGSRIRVTSLDRLYGALGRKSYAPVLPLVPPVLRRLELGKPDAVVISHHAFAANAVHATDVPAVAYVHSPARWAWDKTLRAGEADGVLGNAALTALSAIARRGERSAAPLLAGVVANSNAVAERIRLWWDRDATVVHPPVDTDFFTPDSRAERGDYFLLAGRLVPYKRPDIAVRAARLAGVPLVVAGDGRYLEYCKSIAGPETTFLGRVSGERLLELHRNSRALVMPGIEDFGIVPVEAMACGAPVLALGAGGALDSVVPGLSGQLIEAGDDNDIIEGFASAMSAFDAADFDGVAIRAHAEGFSRSEFRRRMRDTVDSVL
ncbi:glycosyltransferase [Actinomycetes bacterium M1A6_2h]